LVDGRLIVNPGSPQASTVALDAATGKELWRCPGSRAAYASFIVGNFGGMRQIVGYDGDSLGGWDVENGNRVWTLIPPNKGDFNTPTPIAVDGKLLVSSENNGTRLYDFDDCGVIVQTPVAEQCDLAPDSSTPVVLAEECSAATASCSASTPQAEDAVDSNDKAFGDYVSLYRRIGSSSGRHGSRRVLLLDANGDRFELISRLQVVDGDMYSHPALVGNRLYLRGPDSVRCLILE